MTPARVFGAASRRFSSAPERLAWKIGSQRGSNLTLLDEFRDRHLGGTGVVIANGPSLNRTNLEIVSKYPTISMNRAYLAWPDWGFNPDYFVAINSLVLEQFHHDISNLQCTKFIDARSRKHYQVGNSNLILLNTRYGLHDTFDTSGRTFSTGGTVTFVALQLAFLMGFHRVVIVGLDHRFQSHVSPNLIETRDSSPDTDHFRPDYFPSGVKWQGPDLKRSEVAFSLARDAFHRAGRTIIDATVGGACDVFQKMSLDQTLGT